MGEVGVIERKVQDIYSPVLEVREPVREVSRAVKVLRREFKLIVSPDLVAIVFSAFLNGRPVLFEGPPGTGKTEIGYALLTIWSGRSAFILPCSENYDEYRVIGDFHPLMAMKMGFSEESFIPRPLLAAMILDVGVLVDEIRRSNEEFQNLLLDIVDKRRIIVPELKRVFYASKEGFQVIFTSNPEDIAQGELSDAFLRRVIRVKFEYPPREVEKEIVRIRLSEDSEMITPKQLNAMEEVVKTLREKLTYRPGPADLVAWAQVSVSLAKLRGKSVVDAKDLSDAARSVLCKRDEDMELVLEVVRELIGGE